MRRAVLLLGWLLASCGQVEPGPSSPAGRASVLPVQARDQIPAAANAGQNGPASSIAHHEPKPAPRMEVRSEAEIIAWHEARRRDVYCSPFSLFDGEADQNGAELAEAMRRGDKVAARRAISGGAATFASLSPGQKRWIDRTRLSGRLNDAAQSGDLGRVKRLLAQGADPNIAFENDSSLSAVAIAARCNRSKALRLLIAGGGEVDRRVRWTNSAHYQYESPPLSLAVNSYALDSVEGLLAAGADPNGLEYYLEFGGYVWAGPPLLTLPSRAIARALLRAGADPNYADPETRLTPLMAAAGNNDPGLVRLLLQYGADPDMRNNDGRTAAGIARDEGALEALAVLRKPTARLRPDRVVRSSTRRPPPRSPTPAGKGKRPSEEATSVSRLPGEEPVYERFPLYSEAAATIWLGRWWEDVLCRDPDWSEPVRWDQDSGLLADALRRGDLKLARIEVAGRAATPPGLNRAQQKWLTRARQSMRLVRASARGDLEQVRTLIAQGADPTMTVEDSSTIGALAQAAQCNYGAVVKVLIRAGAKVDQKFSWSWQGMELRESTPLALAAQSGALSSVRALLAAGANPNLMEITRELPGGGDRHSPLMLARTDAIVEALLEAGADANLASPVSGDTPLMYAARMNSPQRIGMLLKHGADLDARNKQGETAADLAKGIGASHAYATLKRAAGKKPAG